MVLAKTDKIESQEVSFDYFMKNYVDIKLNVTCLPEFFAELC
jgi:hypothetical protein